MNFESKKEEFLYYAIKCEKAKQKKDKKQYLINLKKVEELLPLLEEEKGRNSKNNDKR